MYTVLFTYDTDTVRQLFCEALRRYGYRVLEAEDGPKALSVARGHPGPIHLLITDITMPRMGGLELRRTIRGCHPETSVLFISGYSEDALDAGDPFLQKPFTPIRLFVRAAEFCKRAKHRGHLGPQFRPGSREMAIAFCAGWRRVRSSDPV
jgi:two-component system, cell cycle sensor histidine kinase and response regulator CckA